MDTESVYRQLREQIVSGVYRAGDRLPEVSLSAALAVSRTPVREALRRLESDGLVQGSGPGRHRHRDVDGGAAARPCRQGSA